MNYIQKKMNKKIISVFIICLLLIGMTPVAVGMNNYENKIRGESSNTPIDSNSTVTGMVIISGGHIDRDGYLIFSVKNRFEYDMYNISFDIKFLGGVPFFKGNSK